MSAEVWVHRRLEDALGRAFEQIDRYVTEGYCTREDVTHALATQWGEDLADYWDEWIEGWGE